MMQHVPEYAESYCVLEYIDAGKCLPGISVIGCPQPKPLRQSKSGVQINTTVVVGTAIGLTALTGLIIGIVWWKQRRAHHMRMKHFARAETLHDDPRMPSAMAGLDSKPAHC
jgi:hypothetical protein